MEEPRWYFRMLDGCGASKKQRLSTSAYSESPQEVPGRGKNWTLVIPVATGPLLDRQVMGRRLADIGKVIGDRLQQVLK